MPVSFNASDKEYTEAMEWLASHDCEQSRKGKELNKRVCTPVSNYSFKFTSTSLGTLVSIECCCGESKDVTDVSTW